MLCGYLFVCAVSEYVCTCVLVQLCMVCVCLYMRA